MPALLTILALAAFITAAVVYHDDGHGVRAGLIAAVGLALAILALVVALRILSPSSLPPEERLRAAGRVSRVTGRFHPRSRMSARTSRAIVSMLTQSPMPSIVLRLRASASMAKVTEASRGSIR